MSDIKYHDLLRDYEVAIDNGINVQLLDEELWEELFRETNEMYATIIGSSLAPELRIRITGLDHFEMYATCIEFELRSNKKWNYLNGSWKVDNMGASTHEFVIGFMHPDSYQNGFGWMEKPVDFKDMRISVNEFATKASEVRNLGNMVFLNPFSRYIPIIKIFKLEDGIFLTHVYTKTLDVCQFITVISYRNPKMIEKKGKVSTNRESEVYLLRREEGSFRAFPNEEYIRDMATFVPRTLKVQDMKNIDFIWSSALFAGGNRMNFFTFVELYQIKNNMFHEEYSLNLFINEIENNNLNLPNVSLNISERSEGSLPTASEGVSSPERTSTPAVEGAVGGTINREALSEYDKRVKEAFLIAAPDYYIAKSAIPLEDFLDAFLILKNRLPRISEEVLEELRSLTPIHRIMD